MSHGGARPGAGRPKNKGRYEEATKPIRIPVSLIPPVMKIIKNKGCRLPLYSSKVQAGAPGLADDYIEAQIDINEHLIKNHTSTFLVQATGDSMLEAGIHQNDILVVDRGIKPLHGQIAIVALDGQLTVKRLHIKNHQLLLMPENKKFKPIAIKEGNEIYIWGIVTYVIHAV
jgi:DNA polymerase V